MHSLLSLFLPAVLTLLPGTAQGATQGTTQAAAQGPTADDLTKLIDRLVELDSIDLARDVKFRPGLEPSLHAVDADESGMVVLEDPHAAHGRGQPAAAGWYRVSFVAPETIGKFALPKTGYN